MDLKELEFGKVDTGSVMELIHPLTGEVLKDEESGEAISITLLGSDSAIATAEQHKRSIKRLRQATLSKEEVNGTMSDDVDLLVACTVSWKHIKYDGQNLPCNPENVRRFYSDPKFRWLREQVMGHIYTRANYLGN